jgi:hypothetical protein
MVLIDTDNQTELVKDIAVPLTYNFSKTEAKKITKYGKLALEIKNTWKLNNLSIYPLFIPEDRVVTRSFPKYPQSTGLTRNYLGVWQKASLLQTCHIERKFLGHAP